MYLKLLCGFLLFAATIGALGQDSAPASLSVGTSTVSRSAESGQVGGVCAKISREFPQLVPLLDLDSSGTPQVPNGSFVVDCAKYVFEGLKKIPGDYVDMGRSLYGLLIQKPYHVLKSWQTKGAPSKPSTEDAPAPTTHNSLKQGLEILWCLKPDVRQKYFCMEVSRQLGFAASGAGLVKGAQLLSREQKLLNPVIAETSPRAQERLDKIVAGKPAVVKPEIVPAAKFAEPAVPQLPRVTGAATIEYGEAAVISGVKDYKPFVSASGSQNGGLATASYQGKEVFLKHPVPGNPIYAKIFDREATNALHASQAKVGPHFYGTTTVGGKKALVMQKLEGELIHDFNVGQEFVGAVRGSSRAELQGLSNRLEAFEKYIHKYEIAPIDFQVMLTKDKKLFIIDTAHFIPRSSPETPILLKKMKEIVSHRLKDLP